MAADDVLSDALVVRAARLAAELHADDVRKGSSQPYFEGHLEPVARIVAEDGGSAVQVAAAYLHDAAEDHGGTATLERIRAEFGDEVAAIVADCSDSLVDTTAGEQKQPWRTRKEAYLASLPMKGVASLEVTAADKLQNATAIADDHLRLGDELWSRFTTGRAEDQRWYYESLATQLASLLPDHPTVARLQEAVRRIGAQLDR